MQEDWKKSYLREPSDELSTLLTQGPKVDKLVGVQTVTDTAKLLVGGYSRLERGVATPTEPDRVLCGE